MSISKMLDRYRKAIIERPGGSQESKREREARADIERHIDLLEKTLGEERTRRKQVQGAIMKLRVWWRTCRGNHALEWQPEGELAALGDLLDELL